MTSMPTTGAGIAMVLKPRQTSSSTKNNHFAKKETVVKSTTKRTVLALCLALYPTGSMAEEQPIGVHVLTGIYICDTAAQVKQLIAQHGLPLAGCGHMTAVAPADVILLEIYEADGYRFALTRYEFTVPVPWKVQTQYGWLGTAHAISVSPEGTSL